MLKQNAKKIRNVAKVPQTDKLNTPPFTCQLAFENGVATAPAVTSSGQKRSYFFFSWKDVTEGE